jgi:hypothetical protein
MRRPQTIAQENPFIVGGEPKPIRFDDATQEQLAFDIGKELANDLRPFLEELAAETRVKNWYLSTDRMSPSQQRAYVRSVVKALERLDKLLRPPLFIMFEPFERCVREGSGVEAEVRRIVDGRVRTDRMQFHEFIPLLLNFKSELERFDPAGSKRGPKLHLALRIVSRDVGVKLHARRIPLSINNGAGGKFAACVRAVWEAATGEHAEDLRNYLKEAKASILSA